MNIYKATKEDLSGVANLFNMYRVFYQQPSNVQKASQFLSERFEKEESVIFVAVENGNYLGFTQLYPSFSSVSLKRLWILNDLFVHEKARKRGIGKKLLAAAKEYAEKSGAKGLTLQTAKDNFSAQRLYENNGYKQDADFLYYDLTL
ncbi:GNAT family N-acetyltransferase [Bacillus aquiflavi]|uniref:GNAT family N-acetyltransferase n=1 Tax=Bacillus aquiflavi TaxID=2672567 RepID=A0A6B3VYB7_9BACI|nr:GNAT family N-acetyltransferase [Bacillus aquiflavi]MBA4536186.1 GNAT family N-acetyltransferase [Bacillus aquiflavi]NEY83109.1 GNAT family N-acetyltransferase [Bacillus aquiflavi]UAC46977.1 GNAT family N-acetyltransferase [Bacillus aquiflavi]